MHKLLSTLFILGLCFAATTAQSVDVDVLKPDESEIPYLDSPVAITATGAPGDDIITVIVTESPADFLDDQTAPTPSRTPRETSSETSAPLETPVETTLPPTRTRRPSSMPSEIPVETSAPPTRPGKPYPSDDDYEEVEDLPYHGSYPDHDGDEYYPLPPHGDDDHPYPPRDEDHPHSVFVELAPEDGSYNVYEFGDWGFVTCDKAQDVGNISTRDDCGWQGITEEQCFHRGCCFDESYKNSSGTSGCHSPWYKKGLPKYCSVTERYDCHASTMKHCLAKGCCWAPVANGAWEPSCFKPSQYEICDKLKHKKIYSEELKIYVPISSESTVCHYDL